MFVLPLFTHSGSGLDNKHDYLVHEFVCLKNVGDKHFENQGKYPPVEAKGTYKAFHPRTTIKLSAGIRIGCSEPVEVVGRLEKKGYKDLIDLWQGICKDARDEAW